MLTDPAALILDPGLEGVTTAVIERGNANLRDTVINAATHLLEASTARTANLVSGLDAVRSVASLAFNLRRPASR